MKTWQSSIEQTTQKGALGMILVHENMALVDRTNHPKKGALEMILIHENLAIVNRIKHPNNVEKKVQEGRT